MSADPAPMLLERLGASTEARLWRVPGRVNLLGEHVDYLGGTVLPFSCDLELWCATVPAEGRVILSSLEDPSIVDLPLPPSTMPAEPAWGRYVWGVLFALERAGHDLRGVRGVLTSQIPAGAGLSSSAALEAAVALAVTEGQRPRPEVLREAEQIATGVPCGIMDQVAVLYGRADHVLAVDCGTVTWEQIPLPSGLGFVILDTGTRRRLDDGRYAERRTEAEDAVATACGALGAGSIRELHPDDIEALGAGFPEALRRRLRHVLTELERVRNAIDALEDGDLTTLGGYVDASHTSLRDDFEVSSEGLDAAAEALRATPGCLGARLVGAGFAGCVLGVVHAEAAADVARRVRRALLDQLPEARTHVVRAVDGATEVPVVRGS